jgi:hypothetical protein
MPISDLHAETINEVRVTFGVSGFACDPDEVTRALGVEPDEVEREGQVRVVTRRGREIRCQWNSWVLISRSRSKDVNVQIRELLGRLEGVRPRWRDEFGVPSFSVMWKGNYLYAGSGPFYEADVIAGIAALGAELWQDIYQVDDPAEAGEAR